MNYFSSFSLLRALSLSLNRFSIKSQLNYARIKFQLKWRFTKFCSFCLFSSSLICFVQRWLRWYGGKISGTSFECKFHTTAGHQHPVAQSIEWCNFAILLSVVHIIQFSFIIFNFCFRLNFEKFDKKTKKKLLRFFYDLKLPVYRTINIDSV